MSRDDPHFRLRFPEDLKEKVQKAAEENRRSMTAEILERLDASFSGAQATSNDFKVELSRLEALLDWDRKKTAVLGKMIKERVDILKSYLDLVIEQDGHLTKDQLAILKIAARPNNDAWPEDFDSAVELITGEKPPDLPPRRFRRPPE